ncbi:MAG: hypothetical protein ABWY71_01860 [Candidatus Saccharimonadales bacterium]
MENELESQQPPKSEQPSTKRKGPKSTLLVIASILVLVGIGGIAYNQWRKLQALDSRNSSLTAQVKQLTTSNTDLKAKNVTLSNSVKVLTGTQAKASKPTGSSSTTDSNSSKPAPGASLTINKVQIVTPSYFGNTGTEADTYQLRAIFITMGNLTASSQTYNLLDFTATTDKGEIVKPLIYAGPASGNFWNSSTLAAGGSTNQAITFKASDNIVTLQWTPSGSDTISLPIPAATN